MIRFVIALLTLLPSALLAGPKGADFNQAGIKWWSFEAGRTEAMQENKPIFMLVHADWCPACREYRKQFFDPAVVDLSKKYVFVMVDRDSEGELAARYAPDGNYIPRSMVLSSNGRHLERIKSAYPNHRWYVDPQTPVELIRMLKAGLSVTERKTRLPQIVN